jgi:predicted restriction endonuclease
MSRFAADWEGSVAATEDVEILGILDGVERPGQTESVAEVKIRVGQAFFRRAVMAAYDFTCCICGIGDEELLVACRCKRSNVCIPTP